MFELAIDSEFWLSVFQIIAIDIMLGGDNAVVIALACRRLPDHQRNKGIFWGMVGAIVLRIILIFFALKLMDLPLLKLCGAVLLLWIGVKLLQPEEAEEHANFKASSHLLGAIQTIIIADVVMSIDNVIAVAGAAKGHMGLVVFGILISIPIIIWGSKFVLKLMDRFPMVIVFGGGLLGWIAGDMAMTDVVVRPYLVGAPDWLHYASMASGAAFVVAAGTWLGRRKTGEPSAIEELVVGDASPDTQFQK